jgi:Flp pilus assembly protein TadD
VHCFTEAIRRDPTDAEAHLQRGLALMKLGDATMAVDDFGEAVRLAPEVAEHYLARSRAYEQLGRTEEARADRKQALRLDPSAGKAQGGAAGL